LKLEQQHDHMDWGQQGVMRPGSPEAWSREERERKRIRGSILKFIQDIR
jgi:hypothetical protein